ncbi:MAG: T9SS type A sorting domain-containing protein [Saprospiraceae bacterium]|nr:T9SS type A sorting domain-containing protein [Candidatus Defluviibacterium haderslevense]
MLVIKKNTLKIYPNPIIEELICESEIENGYYTIISIEGLKIATGTYVNGEIISVSKIPAGMYTLLLQDSQKHTYQRSFIKL